MSDHLMQFYHKIPMTFVRGQDVLLYDQQGRDYLDAITGIGVTALGHHHPKINQVMHEQLNRLLHIPNNFQHPAPPELAKKLSEISGLHCVGFSNSGSEAVELALKLALKYGVDRKLKTPKIVVMEGGYHGRTFAAWSASCSPIHSQFGPLLPLFIRVPFNDIAAVRALQDTEIIAVLLEPIFGKGGLLPAGTEYLRAVRELCDQRDWLLIADEIQSGLGRTGKWFAYQFADILPDVVTVAKCLGNGIPIGACIAHKKLAHTLKVNDHGGTQAGNVFACTVALAVLQAIEEEHLLTNAANIGEYLCDQLVQALRPFSIFEKIRGKGLMLGIQLSRAGNQVVSTGIKHGIVINALGQNVIRLLPPLIFTQSHADLLVARLRACFIEWELG